MDSSPVTESDTGPPPRGPIVDAHGTHSSNAAGPGSTSAAHRLMSRASQTHPNTTTPTTTTSSASRLPKLPSEELDDVPRRSRWTAPCTHASAAEQARDTDAVSVPTAAAAAAGGGTAAVTAVAAGAAGGSAAVVAEPPRQRRTVAPAATPSPTTTALMGTSYTTSLSARYAISTRQNDRMLPVTVWVRVFAFCADEHSALTLRAVSRSLNSLFLIELARVWGASLKTSVDSRRRVVRPTDSTRLGGGGGGGGALARRLNDPEATDGCDNADEEGDGSVQCAGSSDCATPFVIRPLVTRLAESVFSAYGAVPRTSAFSLTELLTMRLIQLKRHETHYAARIRTSLRRYLGRHIRSSAAAAAAAAPPPPPFSAENVLRSPIGRRAWEQLQNARSAVEVVICEWLATAADARRLHGNFRRGLFNSTVLPLRWDVCAGPVVLPSGIIAGVSSNADLDIFAPCQTMFGNLCEGARIAPRADETPAEAQAREEAARRYRLKCSSRTYLRNDVSLSIGDQPPLGVFVDPVRQSLIVPLVWSGQVNVQLAKHDLNMAMERRLASPSVFCPDACSPSHKRRKKTEKSKNKTSEPNEYVRGAREAAAHVAFAKKTGVKYPCSFEVGYPNAGEVEAAYLSVADGNELMGDLHAPVSMDVIGLPRLLLHTAPCASSVLAYGIHSTRTTRDYARKSALPHALLVLFVHSDHVVRLHSWSRSPHSPEPVRRPMVGIATEVSGTALTSAPAPASAPVSAQLDAAETVAAAVASSTPTDHIRPMSSSQGHTPPPPPPPRQQQQRTKRRAAASRHRDEYSYDENGHPDRDNANEDEAGNPITEAPFTVELFTLPYDKALDDDVFGLREQKKKAKPKDDAGADAEDDVDKPDPQFPTAAQWRAPRGESECWQSWESLRPYDLLRLELMVTKWRMHASRRWTQAHAPPPAPRPVPSQPVLHAEEEVLGGSGTRPAAAAVTVDEEAMPSSGAIADPNAPAGAIVSDVTNGAAAEDETRNRSDTDNDNADNDDAHDEDEGISLSESEMHDYTATDSGPCELQDYSSRGRHLGSGCGGRQSAASPTSYEEDSVFVSDVPLTTSMRTDDEEDHGQSTSGHGTVRGGPRRRTVVRSINASTTPGTECADRSDADTVHLFYPPASVRETIEQEDTEAFGYAWPAAAAAASDRAPGSAETETVAPARGPAMPPRSPSLVSRESVPCLYRYVRTTAHTVPVSLKACVTVQGNVLVQAVGGSPTNSFEMTLGSMPLYSASSVVVLRAPVFTPVAQTTSHSTAATTATSAAAAVSNVTAEAASPHSSPERQVHGTEDPSVTPPSHISNGNSNSNNNNNPSTVSAGESEGRSARPRPPIREEQGDFLLAVLTEATTTAVVILQCRISRFVHQYVCTDTAFARASQSDGGDGGFTGTLCKTVYTMKDYYYVPGRSEDSITQLDQIPCQTTSALVCPRPWLTDYVSAYQHRVLETVENVDRARRYASLDAELRLWMRCLGTGSEQTILHVQRALRLIRSTCGKSQAPYAAQQREEWQRCLKDELAQNQLSPCWNPELNGHPYFGAAQPFFFSTTSYVPSQPATLSLAFQREYTTNEKLVWPQASERPIFCSVRAPQLSCGPPPSMVVPPVVPTPTDATAETATAATAAAAAAAAAATGSSGTPQASRAGTATPLSASSSLHASASEAEESREILTSGPRLSSSSSLGMFSDDPESEPVSKNMDGPLLRLVGNITALTVSPRHAFFVGTTRDGHIIFFAPRLSRRGEKIAAEKPAPPPPPRPPSSPPPAPVPAVPEAMTTATTAADEEAPADDDDYYDEDGASDMAVEISDGKYGDEEEEVVVEDVNAYAAPPPASAAEESDRSQADATGSAQVSAGENAGTNNANYDDTFRGLPQDAIGQAETLFPRHYEIVSVGDASATANVRQRTFDQITQTEIRRQQQQQLQRQQQQHEEQYGVGSGNNNNNTAVPPPKAPKERLELREGTDESIAGSLTQTQQEDLRLRPFDMEEIFGPLCRFDPCLQHVQSAYPCLTSARQRPFLIALTDKEPSNFLAPQELQHADTRHLPGDTDEDEEDDEDRCVPDANTLEIDDKDEPEALALCLPLYFTILKAPSWRVDNADSVESALFDPTTAKAVVRKLHTRKGMAEHVVDTELQSGVLDVDHRGRNRVRPDTRSAIERGLATARLTRMRTPIAPITAVQLHGDWLMTTLSRAFDVTVYDVSSLNPDKAPSSSASSSSSSAHKRNANLWSYPAAISLYSIGHFDRPAISVCNYSAYHLTRQQFAYLVEMRERCDVRSWRRNAWGNNPVCSWRGGVLTVAMAPLNDTGVAVYSFSPMFEQTASSSAPSEQPQSRSEVRRPHRQHRNVLSEQPSTPDNDNDNDENNGNDAAQRLRAESHAPVVVDADAERDAVEVRRQTANRTWCEPSLSTTHATDTHSRSAQASVRIGEAQVSPALESMMRAEKAAMSLPTSRSRKWTAAGTGARAAAAPGYAEDIARAEKLLIAAHTRALLNRSATDLCCAARRLRNFWAVLNSEEDEEVCRVRQRVFEAMREPASDANAPNAESAAGHNDGESAEERLCAIMAAASPEMRPTAAHYQCFKELFWPFFWFGNMAVLAAAFAIATVILLIVNIDNAQYALPFWGIFLVWLPVPVVFLGVLSCRLDSTLQIETSRLSTGITLFVMFLRSVVFPLLFALKWDDFGYAHAHSNVLLPDDPAAAPHFHLPWLAVLSMVAGACFFEMLREIFIMRRYLYACYDVLFIVQSVLVGCFFDRYTTKMPLAVAFIPTYIFIVAFCCVIGFSCASSLVAAVYIIGIIIVSAPLFTYIGLFSSYWEWRMQKTDKRCEITIPAIFVVVFLVIYIAIEIRPLVLRLRWYVNKSKRVR